jgi:response regulator RpfG family c-di-GMP phosphodiesterase
MTPFAMIALGLVGLLTLLLAFYVYVHLPKEVDERLGAMVSVLGTAIELRYGASKGNNELIERLARQVGEAYGLSRRQLRLLVYAARVRDLGMVTLPFNLLNDEAVDLPNSPHRELYDRHAEIGANWLEATRNLRQLAPIVRHHHANFTANPVPPIESRILKVATDFVWAKKESRTPLTEMRLRIGVAYDPAVMKALERVLSSEEPEDVLRIAA